MQTNRADAYSNELAEVNQNAEHEQQMHVPLTSACLCGDLTLRCVVNRALL
jgi:hypothetical protein